MKKSFFALLALSALMLFASSPSAAAPGDLLYRWYPMYPQNIAVDSNGDVYVASYSSFAIGVYDKTGRLLRQWASSAAPTDYWSTGPVLIVLGPDHNVYVNDNGKDANGFFYRIRVYDTSGNLLNTWRLIPGFNNDYYGPCPRGMAVDADGNHYMALWDGAVQVYSSTGTLLRQFPIPGLPNDLAIDSKGELFITFQGSPVRVYSNTGTYLRQIASRGYGNDQLDNPQGITVDRDGHVFVADWASWNYRVQIYNDTGVYLTTWSGFTRPHSPRLDAAGNVYVADRPVYGPPRIQVFEGFANCILTANAGPDQTVEQTSPSGANVTLEGSSTRTGCSADPTYSWSWTGGSATGPSPTMLMPPGSTKVTMTVSSGNVSATADVSITVTDTQKPETFRTTSGIPGANGWYVSDVALAFNASDSGSGVKEIRYSIDGAETIVPGNTASVTIASERAHTLSYFAVDSALNSENTHSVPINIDKTRPTITSAQNAVPSPWGWFNTDVTVTFACSDAVSGIDSCTPPVTVSTEGAGQVVTGTAVDRAGNTASQPVSLNIDKTAPVITASLNRVANPNNWYNTDVTVTFTCSDTLSGIASCPAPVTVTTEGSGQIITGEAVDKAGNTATISVTLKIDKTGPVITVNGVQNGATYELGLIPSASYGATDALSGTATSSASLTGGDNLGLGIFTYTVTASDIAGNTSVMTVTYQVIATPNGLLALLDSLVASGQVDPDIGGALAAKLKGVLDANATAADGKLQAFINQINAQVGKKITPEAAAILINAARYIMNNN